MTAVTMHPRIHARRVAVRTDLVHKRTRRVMTVLLVAFLVALLAYAIQTRLLDVDTIEVTGNEHVPVADILAVASGARGEPLLRLDLSDIRTEIAAVPYVQSVRTSRSWNGTITIDLVERVPVAQLAVDTGWLQIDTAGRVLDSRPTEAAGLARLAGVGGAAAGGWLPSTTLPALELASFIPPAVTARIDGIRIDPSIGVVLDVSGGGLVALGTAGQAEDKLLSVVTFFEQVDLGCLDILDVRVPATPVLTRRAGCF